MWILFKIKVGIIWLCRYHFQVLPSLMWSDVRWGLLQVYLSVALFFVALYFPFQRRAGEPMDIGNYFAYVFLGIGGLLIVYCCFISYRFMRAGSLKNTLLDNASKQDIIDLRSDLVTAMSRNTQILSDLVHEIRQDRNERNSKPKQ